MVGIEANKVVVREFTKSLSDGKVQALSSILSDDVEATCTGTCIMSARRNKAALLEAGAMLAQTFPNGLNLEILSLTAEDDRVSCEMRSSARLASGVPYNNEYHFLFFLRGGQICRIKEYLDTRLVDEVFKPLLTAAS